MGASKCRVFAVRSDVLMVALGVNTGLAASQVTQVMILLKVLKILDFRVVYLGLAAFFD